MVKVSHLLYIFLGMCFVAISFANVNGESFYMAVGYGESSYSYGYSYGYNYNYYTAPAVAVNVVDTPVVASYNVVRANPSPYYTYGYTYGPIYTGYYTYPSTYGGAYVAVPYRYTTAVYNPYSRIN